MVDGDSNLLGYCVMWTGKQMVTKISLSRWRHCRQGL